MAGRSADTPDGRRNLLVRAIVAHRRGDDRRDDDRRGRDPDAASGAGPDADGPPGAAADALVLEGAGRAVAYHDRSIRLAVDPRARERLEALCSSYHVFKVAQPETRKAPDGVVVLSAVTDAKHAADFLEALFREVYGAARDYELRVA